MAQNTINTPRETTIQRIATALENILNKIVDTSRASNIDYDNTESDLTADKVQGAIDELAEEKVDKVTGKGLSTNDYTNAEKQKLANIESNAQANVQSDWNEDDTEDDGYIKNKPNLSTSLSATGNPITIESAESNLVECTAEVEAEQDLHGYDHPWVGGAGKNLLSMTVDGIKAANTSGTWSGNAYSINNGTFEILTDSDNNVIGIKVNGTFNEVTPLNLVMSEYATLTQIGLTSGTTYTINGCPQNGSFSNSYSLLLNAGNTSNKYDEGSGVNITVNDSDTYMIQVYIRSGYNAQNLIFYPMIRLATETDSSFAPYENICPISGRSEVAIDRVGKNKLPMTLANLKTWNTEGTWSGNTYTSGGISFTCYTSDDDAVVRIHAEGTSGSTPGWLSLFKNGTLDIGHATILSGCPAGGGGLSYVLSGYLGNPHRWYVDDGNGIDIPQDIDLEQVYIEIKTGYAIPSGGIDFYPMIRLATETDSSFEPYKGKTYTIQLGDTVYGGQLDVTRGKMVVDRGYKVYDGSSDEGWNSDHEGYRVFVQIADIKSNTINVITNKYKYITLDETHRGVSGFAIGSYYLLIGCLGYSVADWKTYLSNNPLQVVYELATPFTIDLTPQQIRLLKGTNNISCNTGDLSIKYYPDNVLGQLKGDIESEYDSRIEVLEEEAENALKIKSITTTTGTNQQGVSSASYDNYVQGNKKFIPVSITAKTPGYEVVDVHYVLDETNHLIYFIPKDLTGSAIPSGRTVSMTIRYFEI